MVAATAAVEFRFSYSLYGRLCFSLMLIDAKSALNSPVYRERCKMSVAPSPIELELAFEQSFERQPTSSSWGFFAYDDAPGAVGGGAGNFSWFDSKEDLFEFLRKFPLLANSAESIGTERFEKASDLLAGTTAETLDQSVVNQLNAINSGVEQIQWLGQLNELLSGGGEFAEGMRKFFSGSSTPLSKTRIPEFAEFLRGWGH